MKRLCYLGILKGFVLGGDQKVFDGSATLEVSLDAIPTTDRSCLSDSEKKEVMDMLYKY